MKHHLHPAPAQLMRFEAHNATSAIGRGALPAKFVRAVTPKVKQLRQENMTSAGCFYRTVSPHSTNYGFASLDFTLTTIQWPHWIQTVIFYFIVTFDSYVHGSYGWFGYSANQQELVGPVDLCWSKILLEWVHHNQRIPGWLNITCPNFSIVFSTYFRTSLVNIGNMKTIKQTLKGYG